MSAPSLPVVKEKPKSLSGFCGIKSCEGTRPKSVSGKPMKICTFSETCSCSCHSNITRMCEMLEMERPVPTENPEYVAFQPTWWMPGPEDYTPHVALHGAGDTDTPDGPESGAPATSAPARAPLAVPERTFAATASGRRTKGHLEDSVQRVCTQWLAGQIEGQLTPKLIAFEIDEVEPPSVGAIGAVFDRWEKIGYATIARSPVRFTGLTVEGMKNGIEGMKAKAKTKSRQWEDASRRGERPSR